MLTHHSTGRPPVALRPASALGRTLPSPPLLPLTSGRHVAAAAAAAAAGKGSGGGINSSTGRSSEGSRSSGNSGGEDRRGRGGGHQGRRGGSSSSRGSSGGRGGSFESSRERSSSSGGRGAGRGYRDDDSERFGGGSRSRGRSEGRGRGRGSGGRGGGGRDDAGSERSYGDSRSRGRGRGGGHGGRGGGGADGGRGDAGRRRAQQRAPPAAAAAQPPPPVGCLRLFGVKVPASDDPGKDCLAPHEALRYAAARRLGCGGRLPLEAVSMVRKSFDARKAKPKAWAYVIDVDTAAALDAGATRLEIRPGLLEWMPPEEHPAPLPPLPGGERRLLTVTATPPAAAATPPPAPPPEAPPPHAAAAAGGHDSSRRGGGAGAGAGGGKRAVPVVVVGAGPAGLFAALAVAEAGLPVTLLEKGQAVEQRGRDIGALFVRRVLNPESNLCYGEGGAGTWSDGKLTTRIGRNSDPVRQVLATLHALGAPDAVLYSGKPHMGTENLVRILRNFRAHLQALGVTIRFGASVKDFEVTNGRCSGVVLTDGERLPASAVVLAPGHSARPLYTALADRGVALSAKPFALGFRVEHPQVWLDEAQYGAEDARGVMRGKGKLPVADYTLATNIMDAVGREDAVDGSLTGAASLTGQSGGNGGQSGGAQPNGGSGAAAVGMQGTTGGCCGGDEAMHTSGVSSGGGKGSGGGGGGGSAAGAGGAEGVVVSEGEGSRGVYSFCMCPGGQIVPTSTQEDELCINGMSFSKRSSPWCNSALVVAVRPRDWERYNDAHGPLAGVELQREMEREGARRGGGGLVAPVQRVEDFLEGRVTATARLPRSSYRLGVRSTPLHDLYPLELSRALTAALTEFDRRLPGFATGKGRGLLHGVETRTSAPVRVERRQEDCCSVSLEGLYPSGEGAGYAGGIVSAAVDGLRVGGAVVEALTGVDIGLGF